MCHRSDDIIENFLLRQGTESSRLHTFWSDAVVVFDRIQLVGWSVGRLKGLSEECRSVALPPYMAVRVENRDQLPMPLTFQNLSRH